MSTVNAAAELVEQISSDMYGQSCCAGVLFINVKKAFYSVDHELLVEQLNVYGIRGVANKWLQNYLTNLVIYYHSSDLLDMTCGVPHDFVLGPILFFIYINDICIGIEIEIEILFI